MNPGHNACLDGLWQRTPTLGSQRRRPVHARRPGQRVYPVGGSGADPTTGPGYCKAGRSTGVARRKRNAPAFWGVVVSACQLTTYTGAERARTADLLVANQTLSQLSYGPFPSGYPTRLEPIGQRYPNASGSAEKGDQLTTSELAGGCRVDRRTSPAQTARVDRPLHPCSHERPLPPCRHGVTQVAALPSELATGGWPAGTCG